MNSLTIDKNPNSVAFNEDSELDYVYGCKLLIVDDEPITTDMLEAMFSPFGYDILAINNSLLVNEALLDFEPDLILLDINMPGKNGFEISKELKTSPQFRHIPIILLTAMDDQQAIIKGLSFGVQDYITKPFHKAELMARVLNNLRLKKQQDFWRLNHTLMNEQFDSMGVPLKSTFCQYLQTTVANHSGNLTLAVFGVYGLDEMIASLKTQDAKAIIHSTIFERLHKDNPVDAFCGSLGDGKFGLLLKSVPERQDAYLQKLVETLEKVILISGSNVKLKVNVGFYQRRCDNESWQDILQKAEFALLEATKPEAHSIQAYSPKNHDQFNEKWWIYQNLQSALSADEIDVFFQPQFDLYNWECTGYEALARWKHREAGFISPKKFIPIAEKHGLIEPLSLRVLEKALQCINLLPAPKISLNISPVQLRNSAFPIMLAERLEKRAIQLNQVELELTESTMMDKQLLTVVEHLMQLGFKIVIDDFGTGYSNLSLLTQLPFSKVKIASSLIEDIHICKKSAALVSAIVSFSGQFGSKVLAEGVELSAQAETLRNIGVDEVQGSLFGKARPMPCAGKPALKASKTMSNHYDVSAFSAT